MENIVKIKSFVTVLFVGVFSFLIPFLYGSKGMVYHDHCILIDGAWRLLKGQVIYRDFSIFYGPLTFYLQALFFKIFGLSVFAAVLHAAVMNAMAALLTFWGLKKFFHANDLLATGATLVTGYWFYTPLSWPWFETTGYFFFLVAFLLLLQGSRWAIFMAGVSTALTFLCKANVALASLIVMPTLVLYLLPREKRREGCFLFSLGFLLTGGAWLSYLLMTDSFHGMWTDLVVRPAKIKRLNSIVTLPGIFFGQGITFFMILLAWFRCRLHEEKNVRYLNILAIFLGVYQIIVASFSAAGAQANNIPFIGWMGALFVLGLMSPGSDVFPSLDRLKGKIVFFVFWLVLIGYGQQTASYRTQWLYGFGISPQEKLSSFISLNHPRLKGMKIQAPYAQDLQNFLQWSQSEIKEEDDIFVMPTMTMLYFVLNKVPPQPFVLLYPEFAMFRDLADHEKLIHSLEIKKPKWVILETRAQMQANSTEDFFQHYPELADFLERHYILYKSLPGFNVLKISS